MGDRRILHIGVVPVLDPKRVERADNLNTIGMDTDFCHAGRPTQGLADSFGVIFARQGRALIDPQWEKTVQK